MISPRQRHPYRHFSLSAISPCIIRNQTDIDRFVGLSYLAVQCIFPRYLINQTGSTIQRDNRTAFNDYFFGVNRISAGISTLSILCPPSISILSKQYTNGPRFTTTWLRISSANGFASSNFTGISITHSTQSPFFQMRFTSAYVFAFQVPCTGSPLPSKLLSRTSPEHGGTKRMLSF